MDTSKTAERIKEMRKKRGIKSQAALAEIIGSDSKTVTRWENGDIPSLDKYIKLADALDCSPEFLLGCVEHPSVTTSWISEQIPLSEEAIDYLVELNGLVKEYEWLQFGFNHYVEAKLIDKLICALNEGIPDKVNNIRWDAEQLMNLLVVADREDEQNENINHRMMIRQSFCMAFGGVAFDFISEFANKHMASLMIDYEKSQMVEDEMFIAKVDRRKEELGITQDEYVKRVFQYLNRGYVYIKACAAALEVEPDYLKVHTLQDIIDFSDDPERRKSAISAILKEYPKLFDVITVLKNSDELDELMYRIEQEEKKDGNI